MNPYDIDASKLKISKIEVLMSDFFSENSKLFFLLIFCHTVTFFLVYDRFWRVDFLVTIIYTSYIRSFVVCNSIVFLICRPLQLSLREVGI